MRTSEIAKVLGIDSQTILNWIRKPEVETYFTNGAKAIGVKQATYTQEDLVVLNTISELSKIHLIDGRKINWGQIAAELRDGYRKNDLPDLTMSSDGRSVPMGVVRQLTDLAAIAQERDNALSMVQYLEKENAKKDSKNEELQRRIDDLNREAAKWQAMYEMAVKGQGSQ